MEWAIVGVIVVALMLMHKKSGDKGTGGTGGGSGKGSDRNDQLK